MRTQRIGLMAFLSLLATLAVDNFQFIQNPKSKLHNFQVLAQTPDARKSEADRLFHQGVEQYDTSQVEAAKQSWQQALAIYQGIKDRQGEGASLDGLGRAYSSLGDYVKAIEYHQQSLAIAREIKHRQGEGASLGNLGVAYSNLGDYVKAIEYQQQRLAIARDIKDRQGEGQSLGNLGIAYSNLGDYAKAIEYHQQSLAIAREINDRLGEGNALGSMGITYSNLGDYAKAIEYHQQHLAIARAIKHRQSEGASLGNLGSAYLFLGDYAKAIDYYQQHLAIARSIKDRLGEGQALGNLGSAYYSLGDYVKAIEYHQQSLAIQQEIDDKQGEGGSLNNLGLALRQSGNFTQAVKILRAGIEVWESQRERLRDNDAYKVSIFEEQARTYILLQTVLIAQNNPHAALEISERGRARAFVELLRRRNATTSNSANSPIDPPSSEQLQQIAKQQNATLVEYSRIIDEFKIKDKQEIHESELYIWVIKPTGEIIFRRSDIKPVWQQQNTTLADLVTVARESIGVRGRGGLGVVAKVDEADQTKRF